MQKIIGLTGHCGADFRNKLMQKCIFSFKTGPLLLVLIVQGSHLWELVGPRLPWSSNKQFNEIFKKR